MVNGNMSDIYDLSVCINEADSFLLVAKNIEDDFDTFLCGGMYPFTVNAAFACELYMKAIFIHNSSDGTIPKLHKLDELFDKLPKDAKVQIEALFSKQYKHDLLSLLSEISNAFIEWRYAFENGVKINITGLLAFANALQEYVDSTIRENE